MTDIFGMDINSIVIFYILIFLVIIFESFAISFLKESIKKPLWTIMGVLTYVVVALTFREILKFGKLGIANAIWNTGSIILVSIISIVVYKEKFTNSEKIGIVLAILSTICMVWDTLKKLF